jgi:hypothetical protein
MGGFGVGEAMVEYRLNTTGAVATRIGASEATAI